MAVENLQEVKDYFETNKDNEDIKTYLNSFLTKDTVGAFLETESARSIVDSISGKAVEAYKGKGMLKELEKAKQEEAERVRKELNPKETTEQKELREIKEMLQKEKANSLVKELLINKTSLFNEKGYDIKLSEFVNGENIEQIRVNADKLNNIISELVTKQVKEKLESGYKPPNTDTKSNDTVTKEQFEKMGYSERLEIANNNPELYNQLKQ
jgi:hypothetical protein